jgi:shikimate dehydrogenase
LHVTLKAAVLGHPISHSKSPALHQAAYARLGVDIAYSAIDVTVPALPSFMAKLRAEKGWRGLSVTMPLKSAMVAEVDEVRGVAGILGVVNTVVFETEGQSTRSFGYNTDVAGIVNAVRHAGVASAPAAVVLGGGGTAAAAIAALKDLGAPSADIYVRDVRRAAEARAASEGVGLSIRVLPISGAASAMAAADVVISTLPPRGADALADELAGLHSATAGVLLDVAYDPWPSRITSVWQDGGGTVVPGLEMLIYQAVEQIRHFTGLGDDVTADVIDVMCDAVGAPRRVL